MKLHNSTADVFVPDSLETTAALARTTHLGIGAHQDDLEFMAYHGIEECFGRKDLWFTGVTCTNGAGSSRTGPYAEYTDEQMQATRRTEQRNAATVGGYAAMLQLNYPSSGIKESGPSPFVADLVEILSAAKPKIVYTHNLADKHDTHVAVVCGFIRAARQLPAANRPVKVYGCEIWRDLDWMPDSEKTLLDVSKRENLAAALSGVYDSQISGGKRYDLAVVGRRLANATFFESHGVDQSPQLTIAMDLTPLVQNDSLDVVDYVLGFIDRFKAEVTTKLRQRWGKGH